MTSNGCAACKVLKHECNGPPSCIMAPYFPLTNPQRFENVHKIFGAENVYKILSNLDQHQRENAVTALNYEAEARKHDPISGFFGILLDREKYLQSLKNEIENAQNELAAIIGPDNVPPYVDVPISDDFLTAQSSIDALKKD